MYVQHVNPITSSRWNAAQFRDEMRETQMQTSDVREHAHEDEK